MGRGCLRATGAMLLVAVLVAGCASAAAPPPAASPVPVASPAATAASCTGLTPGERTIALKVDGRDRAVLVHVPQSDAATAAAPVLVAFHGYSTRAADFAEFSGLSAKADEAGFVVVYPQALGDPPEWHVVGGWTQDPALQASDRAFAVAVLDWLAATGCVDSRRVFLAGHSQGGGMVADLACELAPRLAGIGLISALYLRLPCEPSREVPVFVSHAVDDPVLPIGGGRIRDTPPSFPEVLAVETVVERWAAVDGCAGQPEGSSADGGAVTTSWTGCAAPVVYYRTPSGGHDVSTAARDAMWTFFEGLGPG